MKRILFRAVTAFALGEVVYVLADEIGKTDMVFLVMSVFCVVILALLKKRKLFVECFILIFFLFLGSINLHSKEENPPSIYACLRSDYASLEQNTNNSDCNIFTCNEVYNKCIQIDIYGIIIDISPTEKSNKIVMECYKVFCEDHAHTDAFKLIFYDASPSYHIGDYVKASGNASVFSGENNPGVFSQKDYYNSQNIFLLVNNIRDISILKEEEKFEISLTTKLLCFVKYKLYSLRNSLKSRLFSFCDYDVASLYSGLLLGDKSFIDNYTSSTYKLSGISHILAISSQHITMLGACFMKLLLLIGIRRYTAGALSVFFMFLYGMMTGMGVATARSVIMFSLAFVASVAGRKNDVLTSTAIAYIIVLIFNPYKLTEGAAIMSFTAIIGVCCACYILRYFKPKKKGFKYYLVSALVFQISIQLVMLPVLINMFYDIYIFSFVINLLIVPISTYVILIGAIGLIVSFVCAPIGGLLLWIGGLGIKLFNIVCSLVAESGCATFNVGEVKLYIVVIYYLILGFVLLAFNRKVVRRIREKIFKRFGIWNSKTIWKKLTFGYAILVLAVGFALVSFLHFSSFKEKVVFLDVGQGAGALIRCEDGTKIAIDGGSSSEKSLGEYTLIPCIKREGMAHIDYWLVTHTDMDHISGLLDILSNYNLSGIRIDYIVLPVLVDREDDNYLKLRNYAEELDIEIAYMAAGDVICGEDFNIKILAPEEDYNFDGDNNLSLCISYESSSVRALFTGDMEAEAITHMMQSGRVDFSSYDVISVPHHGSNSSLVPAMYEAIVRDIFPASVGTCFVVSCGYKNSYGHPHREVIACLDELCKLGCSYFVTSESGAVVVTPKEVWSVFK